MQFCLPLTLSSLTISIFDPSSFPLLSRSCHPYVHPGFLSTWDLLASTEQLDHQFECQSIGGEKESKYCHLVGSLKIIHLDWVQSWGRQVWRWTVIRQDPYSPDENPCDYDGIERIKRLLRGMHFSTITRLTDAVNSAVTVVNRDRTFQGILNYRTQMNRIVDCGGDYVNHPE